MAVILLCAKCKSSERLSYTSYCRDCNRAYQRERYSKPDVKAAALDYQKNRRHGSERETFLAAERSRQKIRLYGVTSEQYDKMYMEQDGKCLICKEEMKRPVIDHSHATQKVRGLLCSDCNVAIGLFKEDAVKLKSAIKYLEENGD